MLGVFRFKHSKLLEYELKVKMPGKVINDVGKHMVNPYSVHEKYLISQDFKFHIIR